MSEKRVESASFILHWRRARFFYDFLEKVDNELVTVCFDNIAEFSHPQDPHWSGVQFAAAHMYVFGFVVHDGKDSKQTKDDILFYT